MEYNNMYIQAGGIFFFAGKAIISREEKALQG
jgi:hypothetical protein